MKTEKDRMIELSQIDEGNPKEFDKGYSIGLKLFNTLKPQLNSYNDKHTKNMFFHGILARLKDEVEKELKKSAL